uniref:Si:dkey-221l4.11 n=1 Tax=Sinocyclocheilus grahami TaxID=75366 RepID=A0A672N145_SINGR
MHTPASMMMGVVFAPLGLVLVFTLLLLRSDGLWESCLQVVPSEVKECWPVSGSYQQDALLRMVQGMVLSSLFLCSAGIVLASVGVRCWTDIPLRSVAAAGGLLVALAGVLCLAVDSTISETQGLNVHKPPQLTLHPAGSLYFGWVGAWVQKLQVLGGAALLFRFKSMTCSSCHKQRLKDSAQIKLHFQGPEKYERHHQNSPSAISGSTVTL